MNLHLMRPEVLWALLPATLLLALLWRKRRQRGNWGAVIHPDLLPHLVGEETGGRRRNYLPLLMLAWTAAILAASGPSWEKVPQPVHRKQDALVVLLDLSYSMKSADLAPSRLDRARQKILDLLRDRDEGQTALVAYAGDAHVVTPLTDDHPTIENLLPALHPDMMPVPGSDPAAAVARGLELLRSAGVRRGMLLLVTDGIDSGDIDPIGEILQGTGVRLAILGVGTSTGAPIPLPRGGFLRDDAGAIVMPGLDETPLRELAAAGGGRYRRMQVDNHDLEFLLANAPAADFEQQTRALDRRADTWDDKGYLLVLALLPLALALFRRGWLVSLLPLVLFLQPGQAHAQAWDDLWRTRDQQGERALRAGDNARAAQLFEDPAWAGTAAYRAGDYDSAAGHFSTGDSADSWYNRGNALARAGRLDEAIAAYRESLAREPGQQDARQNIEVLEELQRQQSAQQSSPGDQGQQQDRQQQPGQGGQQGQQHQQGQQDQPGQTGQGEESQRQASGQDRQPPQSAADRDRDAQARDADGRQGQPGSSRTAQPEAPSRGEEQTAQAGARPPDPGGTQKQGSTPDSEERARDERQNALTARTDEDVERDQALEQWLRRVPDDPSGLLREKFRYESRQRARESERRKGEQYW